MFTPRLVGRSVPAILLGVLASAAQGQEQYILTEQDTWQAEESVDPTGPEGRLAVARRALAAQDYVRAEHLAGAWIERHEHHPLLPDAYLIRADALNAQSSLYKALFDYEFIARAYPGSEVFVTALQREFQIAQRFGAGYKRKLWGMRIVDASDEAEELLIRIQERMPGSRLAEQAAIELADFYFRRRQMDLAVDMYSIFIENYRDSQWISKARRRLIYAHLATFKGPEFDIAGLREARSRLNELKAMEPSTAQQVGADGLLNRIDESDARKLLGIARWYKQTGDPIAAEMTVRRLVKQYPRSLAVNEALRMMGEILDKLPPSVLAEAPDYEALRAAMLGEVRAPQSEKLQNPPGTAQGSQPQ